jgi:iron complex outermembrane receptor protein
MEESDKIVVTAQEIEKMNVRTVSDLLNQIPGVNAGESSVSLRGSYMVKVILDGRTINDPTSGHRAVKWDMVSVNNIDKIEIHKGGGGVEFGDDSSGGVIYITTKRAKGSHGNIETYGGNLATRNCNMNYHQEAAPFSVGVSAGCEKTDGYRVNGDKEKRRAGIKLGYTLDDNYGFSLSGDYFKEDAGRPGLPAYPTPNARADYETFSTLLLAGNKSVKSKTYFTAVEKISDNPDKPLYTLLRTKTYGENITAKIPAGRWGAINSGVSFELGRLSGNKIDSKQEEKYGIFGIKDIKFNAIPVTLTLGLRGNFYSEFNEAINPEVKVKFEKDFYSIQLSANKTNNIPTFLQRYNETSTTKPNPDLTMEKATNYSLSFFCQPAKSFSGNLSVFYNKITDRITYVRGDEGIGRYENLGKSSYKGVEVSFSLKPVDVFTVKPSYTYLIAKDDLTEKWLACKPKHKVKIDLICNPTENISLTLNTQYVSEQFSRSDNTESVPEYFTADLRAEYGFKMLSLFCRVKNIFDEDYYYGDGYPAPPRTWIAGVGYQF